MMVMLYFFIEDTTGLNLPTALHEIPNTDAIINLFPNPANDIFIFKQHYPKMKNIGKLK